MKKYQKSLVRVVNSLNKKSLKFNTHLQLRWNGCQLLQTIISSSNEENTPIKNGREVKKGQKD